MEIFNFSSGKFDESLNYIKEGAIFNTKDWSVIRDSAEEDLTLLSRRNTLLSFWYIDSTVNAFFFFKISKMRKGIKKRKNIWYCMAGKVESKKLEEYQNENYYLLWWSETAHVRHVLSPKMAGIGGKGCYSSHFDIPLIFLFSF